MMTARLQHPTTGGTATTVPQTSGRESIMLRKRIGSTEYMVKVIYSPTATEPMQDKLLRLIESEVREIA
jgi:hypothetical protein